MQADKDGSGSLSRDELMEMVEVHQDGAKLLRLLQQTKVSARAASMGMGMGMGMAALERYGDSRLRGDDRLSVFDIIETSDGDALTWAELEDMLHGAVQAEQTGGGGGSKRRKEAKISDGTTYILKRCQSDQKQEYVEIYKGAQTTFTVYDLSPGTSYQFRVLTQNREGIDSRHSEAAVYQTMLRKPSPPVVCGRGATTCYSVRLKWEAVFGGGAGGNGVEQHKGARAKDEVDQMLTEWTKAHMQGDGGLDVRKKFVEYLEQYDVDQVPPFYY